jgi:hypothetical protein
MYHFVCNDRLDLVTSPLLPDQERKLRLFLFRRLRKGAIYTGTGNFSGMDFRYCIIHNHYLYFGFNFFLCDGTEGYQMNDIFVNCSWVATRWQQYSTHLHTNNTLNDTKQTMHRTIQKFWKSVCRAPSLQVLPWHLPYN